MLLGARQYFAVKGAASPSYTTLDYIQNDLIAHFDGIENIGRGQHGGPLGTAFAKWYNLKVDGSFLDCMGAVAGADYIDFVGSETGYAFGHYATLGGSSLPSSPTIGFTSSSSTLEYVGRIPEASDFGGGLFSTALLFSSFSGGTRSGRIGFELLDGSVFLRIATGGSASVRYSMDSLSGGIHRLVVLPSGVVVADSETLANPVSSGAYRASGSYFFGTSVGYCTFAHVNALRVYARVLTSEELEHNDAIDKARFNLP